ncbi:MAG: LAGLIDADG family homing endonuclease [Candidatus Nanoarchaeia archaeon]|nr:LAGLIDADG family homing endonuclease [Candidatus Nanoarchaeia archaeon]MDD5740395.1 LAGLIDADG family homing endonuclease [Candidatus Nanoarchaeia archaeon]
MALSEAEKLRLEEFVEEMKSHRARHTELITVYVPKGYDINFITKQLESEKSTAANIKSTGTRKNVQDALESLIRIAKGMKSTPKNGVALFAGNVSKVEGQDNFITEIFEPPEELNVRLYRCDQTFVLEPLEEMLEIKELYGLVVIERQEATIGMLVGKKIKVLQKFDSMVPGKTNKGGQCLSPDTFIMKDDGEIIEIKNCHNPLILVSENFNNEKSELTPVIEKWENEKPIFRIKTKNPVFEISASQDHLFFVRTENGIEEKPLSVIREGDYLIIPSKINIEGKLQEINFKPQKIKKTKEIIFPKFLNEDLVKIFGYYLGDGNWEEYRINFSEQRKEVANYYKNLLESVFKIPCSLRFRENKGYYQLRIHNLYLSQFFREYFPLKNKTLEEEIPKSILISPDNVLASFISGFFDAEGYVSDSRIGLGINNKKIAKQLQLILLRLGIVSSILEYDNRRNLYSNKTRYTIEINGIDSMKSFFEKVGLSSTEKNIKLKKIIEKRGNQDHIDQLVVNGREVAKIIRNSGELLQKFNCPMFFSNKRQMSRQVFKRRILDKIDNSELKRRLEFFYGSNLTIAKINKIFPIGKSLTVDIETKNHNFLANGILVHNSAARYSRIRDNMARDFFRKIASVMKDEFFDLKGLKGILVGGPGPTKEDFVKEGELVTALKEKILAIKDIGYADEHGLELLVGVSGDVLAGQEIYREKKLLENFFNMLGKEKDKTAYKEKDIEKALSYGAVDTLLLSKKLKKEIISKYEKKAAETSVKVELVSVDTPEGQQFWNLGGVGAVLRFRVQ